MIGYVYIFALLIFCEYIAKYFAISIPGSIIGLFLLFIFFYVKKDVPKDIEESSKTLLKYLPLFLVPIGVGIKELFINYDSKLIAMIITSIISLILAVVITVFTIWIVKLLIKKFSKNEVV